MLSVGRLLAFVRPYRWQAALSLLMLTAQVGMDLAIPRLVQRIVDQGIAVHDRDVVVSTASVMLGISLISLLVAIANNAFSVLIGLFVVGMEPLFRRVQQRRDAVNEVLHDNIAGARLVKALVRAAYEEGRFDDANERLTRQSIAAMRVMSFMTPALPPTSPTTPC